jgi:hypothetical protein
MSQLNVLSSNLPGGTEESNECTILNLSGGSEENHVAGQYSRSHCRDVNPDQSNVIRKC